MQIEQNISLRPYNSFGIAASARYFTAFHSLAELQEALQFSHSLAHSPLVLGGGSNILFTKDIDGLVMRQAMEGIDVVDEDENHVYVKAFAGTNWHQLVLYCIRNAYAGMENLSLIPGSAGASPMQNIGAYGVEIKDIFHSLEAYHLKDQTLVTFNNRDCAFGYRESVFKRKFKGQFVITSVTYRLNKIPVFNTSYGAIEQELQRMGVQQLSLQAVSQAVINIRQSKLPDPAVIGNAGSFFKNPQVANEQFASLKLAFPGIVGYPFNDTETKLAAGWLIEQCGWKGYREGDAGCHAQQALVLVNYGNAAGAQVLALSEKIIESVHQKFGVTLEREVNIA